MTNIYYLKHRDDEWFDEVSIRIVPRFKTSGMSGDEWRRSSLIEFKRKGVVIYKKTYGTLEVATAFLPGLLISAGEEGGYSNNVNLCFQPGCSEQATTEYRLKYRYHQGEKLPADDYEYRRKFCASHAIRGDADYEDSNLNYELISGKVPDRADILAQDISPARQVITDMRGVDASDDKALAKALKQVIDDVKGGFDINDNKR